MLTRIKTILTGLTDISGRLRLDMMVTRQRGWAILAAIAVGVTSVRAAAPRQPAPASVLVFAAASLQTALDELTPAIAQATGVTVRTSYAASSALARQIEQGAPADLFISADLEWMDYLSQRRLIRAGSRVELVGNDLVLIAPAGRPVALAIAPGFALARALGRERLAVADPSVVPAGKYAREALTALGVWDTVKDRLAPAENVRGALLLVSRGETPLGIVYRTDALADRGVALVGAFPSITHMPIVYPAALTAASRAEAATVLSFLRGRAARAVFQRLGFTVLP
jgi:molybdate transport system substrate-binding protein